MIDWLKEKFSSIIKFCFILTNVLTFILCALIGYRIAEDTGLIIGLVFALVFGLPGNILTYGGLATIISISNKIDSIAKSSDSIDYMLQETTFDEEISEIKNIVKNIDNSNK